jgi:nitrogen fixation protein FixH
MSASQSSSVRAEGLRGWHVLAMLVAFFGTVFTVNGYFLVKALGTHTGVVSVEPYRKGLHYNDRIAAEARQAALGWRVDVAVTREGSARVVIKDRSGHSVPSKIVALEVGRPSTHRHDRRVELREAAPGVYEASVGPLEDGAWLVAVAIRRLGADDTEATEYRIRRRLWLQPRV